MTTQSASRGASPSPRLDPRSAIRRVSLDKLRIEDAASFRHVALYGDLAALVSKHGVRFRVLPPSAASWDRAVFLNLTFWGAVEGGDVLVEDVIPADVVTHVAWHTLAAAALVEPGATPSSDALFLGEAIASAFDIYLVGRLVGHAPASTFLETQVPAMADCAAASGLDDDAFDALIAEVAADPERAFEDLRALLFDVTRALVRCSGVDEAHTVLAGFEGHRFASLLHRHELSNWVLYARAYAADRGAPEDDARAVTLDRALRTSPDALGWLTKNWVDAAVSGELPRAVSAAIPALSAALCLSNRVGQGAVATEAGEAVAAAQKAAARGRAERLELRERPLVADCFCARQDGLLRSARVRVLELDDNLEGR